MLLHAQTGTWKVSLNNKLLLSTSREDEKINTRNISLTSWKKKGYLEIRFKEVNPNSWRRSFLFFDEADNQLLAKDSVSYVKIPLTVLRKLFTGKKQIRIYTIIAPLDPNIAIRMRRVHLITLKLP